METERKRKGGVQKQVNERRKRLERSEMKKRGMTTQSRMKGKRRKIKKEWDVPCLGVTLSFVF